MLLNIKPVEVPLKKMPIRGWQKFLHEGEAFLKTATAAFDRKKEVFTPEILYNIVAMSIEKFIMAALMQRGALADNHTMRDLVSSMDQVYPGGLDEIRDDLISLDGFQEICDLDSYKRTPPAMEDIPAMLKVASRLKSMVSDPLSAIGKAVAFDGH